MVDAAICKQPAGEGWSKGQNPLPPGRFSDTRGPPSMRIGFTPLILALVATGASIMAQSPYESAADFAKYARKLREQALLKVEPQVFVPTASRSSTTTRYPWKANIVTTVFWVGEQAGGNNPVPNYRSSWDLNWQANYGGLVKSVRGKRIWFIHA